MTNRCRGIDTDLCILDAESFNLLFISVPWLGGILIFKSVLHCTGIVR